MGKNKKSVIPHTGVLGDSTILFLKCCLWSLLKASKGRFYMMVTIDCIVKFSSIFERLHLKKLSSVK